MIAFLVIGAATAAAEFVTAAVKKNSAKIDSQKGELALRTQATGFLADLKSDFEKAKPLFDALSGALPPKDDLINLGLEIGGLGKRFNLEIGFTFGAETASGPDQPASINFSLTGTGAYDNILRFMKEIERSPLYIKVNSIDFTRKPDSGNFGFVMSAEVFYQ